MSVTGLLLTVVLLTAASGLFLWYPSRFRSRDGIDLARRRSVYEAWEQRSAELEAEAERGVMSAEERAQIQTELDRQLLADTEREEEVQATGGRPPLWLSLGLTLAIALGALLVYPWAGNSDQVSVHRALQEATTPEATARVWRSWLDGHPEPQPQWYYELASASRAAGDLEGAVAALAEVADLLRAQETYDPEDLSAVLSERAELRYRLNGESLNEGIADEFREALQLDPLNGQALATLGVAYYGAGNVDEAIGLWERFLEVAPEGNAREAVSRVLAQARRMSGEEGSAEAAPGGVQVLLSGLPESVPSQAQVYVVASPVDSDRPVAIRRLDAGNLPPAIQLTDSDRGPQMDPLSDYDEVSVLAFVVPPDAANLSEAILRSAPVTVPTTGPEAVATLRLQPTEESR